MHSAEAFQILHPTRAERIHRNLRQSVISSRELQKTNLVRFVTLSLAHFFSVRIASSKTGSSAFPETTNSATETKTIRPRTFSPAIIVRDRTCFHQLKKILRPKLTNNANQHTNRNNQNNYGSVETLSSFSSQSGSYHLPSSANFSTLPDRSLAESPHALHIDSDLEKYSEESEDELYSKKD